MLKSFLLYGSLTLCLIALPFFFPPPVNRSNFFLNLCKPSASLTPLEYELNSLSTCCEKDFLCFSLPQTVYSLSLNAQSFPLPPSPATHNTINFCQSSLHFFFYKQHLHFFNLSSYSIIYHHLLWENMSASNTVLIKLTNWWLYTRRCIQVAHTMATECAALYCTLVTFQLNLFPHLLLQSTQWYWLNAQQKPLDRSFWGKISLDT